MPDDDLIHYCHRAEKELILAQRAAKPGAGKAHFMLAEAYVERVASARPTGPSKND